MQPQTPQAQSGASSLDPQAVNLAKAIRQTESGGNFQARGKSGEYGAYQFTKPTWDAYAKKHGINVPLEQATPEQQNEVAYKQIKEWKDQGMNVGQIASMWNSGKPDAYLDQNYRGVNKMGVTYDVPAYAKSVATAYQALKSGQEVGVDPNNPSSTANQTPVQQPNENGAWFQSSPDDSAVTAGLKTAGNLIPSAYGFAKGIVNSMNPINIVKNIGEIGQQFSELSKESGGAGNALTKGLMSLPGAAVNTLVPKGIRQVATGDIAGAQKTFTEDPIGTVAPVVLAAEGGAKLADNLASKSAISEFRGTEEPVAGPVKPVTKYSDAFGKAIETAASPVTKTVGAVGKVLPSAGTVGTSIVSHLTGLDPQTVGQILSNPTEFSKIKQEAMSRPSLASDFSDAIDNVIDTKKDTGAEYGAIRTMTKPVEVPDNFIADTLKEFKLNLKNGKVVADTTSLTRNPADIRALQNFVDNWGKKKALTPEEYLNMRGDIEGIAKHGKEIGTNIQAQRVGKRLYEKANETIGKQIPGLRELDSKMSPLIEQYKQIKKDFLNPDGTFKDGAINKIANATGKGKANLLARMEEVSPGITQRIKILKAVEDIQHASGLKVGTYTRALVGGGGFALAGVPGFIISEILTSPEMAVPILRKAGYLGAKASSIISTLKLLVGDIPKVAKTGAFNQGVEKSPYTGLLPLNKTPTSKQ